MPNDRRNPDPRFPNRPQHPDFWALSEVVIRNDDVTGPDDFKEVIERFVDIESLEYMVMQRTARFTQDPRSKLPQDDLAVRSAVAAALIDGFALGCGYMEKKTMLAVPSPAPPPDGKRRTRS